MEIAVSSCSGSYKIIVERGLLKKVASYVADGRRALVITDDGVPIRFFEELSTGGGEIYLHTVERGEGAKSLRVFEEITARLVELGFARDDYIIALGGGVVIDLSGFVASCYMRGIRYISVPTTTMAQLDVSVGGKCALNFSGYKNMIGAFYPPEIVLIDPDTLNTLPSRHYNSGLVESLKAGLLGDEELFKMYEALDEDGIRSNIDEIIKRALLFKKTIVEKDERDKGNRAILNFGHTLGHALESIYGLSGMLHGECVAAGMIALIMDEGLKKRVWQVISKLGIPCDDGCDWESAIEAVRYDKKRTGDTVRVITLYGLCDYKIEKWTIERLKEAAVKGANRR